MTGIDSALASMLVGRIDSVLDSVGAGARTSPAQSGATGLTVNTPAAPDAPVALADAPPPASAQAILSEVALTLDAISRFGGEATPAVIGEAPIWPAPPAIDAPAAQGGPAASAATNPNVAAGQAQAGSTAATGVIGAAATTLPVEALAEALEHTVNESGLFYESHLAQWLSGGYAAEALASEPQTRLAAEALQLPLDWSDPAAADANAGTAGASGWQVPGGFVPAGGGWLAHELPPQLSLPNAGAGAGGAQYARAAGADWRGVQTTVLEEAAFGRPQAGHAAGAGSPELRASIAASIHPATIPLVRQQLDVLATQQFRWTGEVWPGAKLDWVIEPERERRAHSGGGADETQQNWRTRVTLALPTLGTVDAELVLSGKQLIVRVQASPGGAARLTAGGASFGRRLEAAGIELAGLQIREIGGAAPAAAGATASAATSAYARAAAQAQGDAREAPKDVSDVEAREGGLHPSGPGSFGGQSAASSAKPAPVPSPIDRLFDDPFEWGGS